MFKTWLTVTIIDALFEGADTGFFAARFRQTFKVSRASPPVHGRSPPYASDQGCVRCQIWNI